jgi:hypothetical protein
MISRKPAHLLLVDDDPGLLKLRNATNQRRLQRRDRGKWAGRVTGTEP